MAATSNEIYFKTIEELREQAIKDRACKEGLDWLDKQKSLKEVFEKIPLDYRLWCLYREYFQFAINFNWEKLNGTDWSYFLRYRPQFSKNCNWDKLDGYNLAFLLIEQPQFSNKCDWDKFTGFDWSWLLAYQPKFTEFCDWEKLNDSDWDNLLFCQSKLSKYKLAN